MKLDVRAQPRRVAIVAQGVACGVFALGLAAAIPARAGVVHAAVVRPSHPVPVASKTWRSVPPGPHTVFGTIAALDGAAVTIRLRSGRLVPIDATAALANGAFSAPLFVGKMVAVDGAVQNGKFVAAHIIRLTNLADFPPDR